MEDRSDEILIKKQDPYKYEDDIEGKSMKFVPNESMDIEETKQFMKKNKRNIDSKEHKQ